jgi:hypothetical protein
MNHKVDDLKEKYQKLEKGEINSDDFKEFLTNVRKIINFSFEVILKKETYHPKTT